MKSRSFSIVYVLTLLMMTAAVSCRYVMPERHATYDGGRIGVDLPNGTKNADRDLVIDRETSVVISLPDDAKIFIGKERSPIDKENLRTRLNQLLKDRTEPDQMVYIAASKFNSYGTIVEILNEIRKQKVSRAGLLASRLRADGPARFAVDIPTEPDPSEYEVARPNPLMLVVSVLPDLKLKLNQDDYGSVNDPQPLSAKLAEIFRLREEQFALKPGMETRTDLPLSERVEKTLVVKATRSIKYGDVIKIIDAVKGAGASPIVLQIDDLAP